MRLAAACDASGAPAERPEGAGVANLARRRSSGVKLVLGGANQLCRLTPMPVHAPLPANDTRGLPSCAKAASAAVPRYVESDVIAPNRVIGAGTLSTLKASFWQIDKQETVQIGDPDFISFAL